MNNAAHIATKIARYCAILPLIALCGCEEPIATRQKIVDEVGTVDVYRFDCSAAHLVARDTNGAVWVYDVRNGSRAKIFEGQK